MRLAAIGLLVAAGSTLGGSARADGGVGPQGAATEQRAIALFDRGRRLAREGRCAEAVPVFLESLQQAEGVGPLLNLGHCYETLGKVASAHRWFSRAEEVAAARDDTRRRDEAAQRARAIEKDVPVLVLHVPASLRSASTSVRLDGETVARDRWDRPLPVDPGPHEIEITAPPSATLTGTVTVPGKGARVEWTATTLPGAPVERGAPETAASEARAPASRPARDEGHVTPAVGPAGSAQRTLGLVTGGVGVAGLALGTVFGVLSLTTHSSLVGRCPAYPTCPVSDRAALDDLNRDASTYGTVATIGVVAGAVLIAGGALLFFTAPSGRARP